MISAREGPDVAFEMAQKFHADGVALKGSEIAQRHFKVAAFQTWGSRKQGIARARGYHGEVGFGFLIAHLEANALAGGIYVGDARFYEAASGFGCAIKKQSI